MVLTLQNQKGLTNHRVILFWRPVKENTVVLQLSTEALPSAVVTVVESHCCGSKPLPWFPSKLWFCVQMHWYCGIDAVGGEMEKASQLASFDHSKWRK